MSFTPGPWFFDSKRRVIRSVAQANDPKSSAPSTFVRGNETYVLEAQHGCSGETWLEMSSADAHLIAAAPEMYKLLEYILDWDIVYQEEIACVLAKARGES